MDTINNNILGFINNEHSPAELFAMLAFEFGNIGKKRTHSVEFVGRKEHYSGLVFEFKTNKAKEYDRLLSEWKRYTPKDASVYEDTLLVTTLGDWETIWNKDPHIRAREIYIALEKKDVEGFTNISLSSFEVCLITGNVKIVIKCEDISEYWDKRAAKLWNTAIRANVQYIKSDSFYETRVDKVLNTEISDTLYNLTVIKIPI